MISLKQRSRAWYHLEVLETVVQPESEPVDDAQLLIYSPEVRTSSSLASGLVPVFIGRTFRTKCLTSWRRGQRGLLLATI